MYYLSISSVINSFVCIHDWTFIDHDLMKISQPPHKCCITTLLSFIPDSYINVNLYRPMTVFSGSFAERGSSPKQKALMDQEVAFEKVGSPKIDLISGRKSIWSCISLPGCYRSERNKWQR